MEVIMHRGRCVFKKKKIESGFLTQVLSQTPRASFEAGYSWLHYQTVMSPHPPRQDLKGAMSRVYSTQLTRSIWSYCFGGRADCKVRRVANSRALAFSWLLRLCMLSLCLSLRASISNCPWGTLISFLSPSAAPWLTTLSFCSFFLGFHSSANQISKVFSTAVQSSLVSFLLYKHHQSKVWMHNHISIT